MKKNTACPSQWDMETFRYYTHRLLPFFLVYFFYEALEFNLLSISESFREPFDFTDLLSLLSETLISFLFCILPYLLYLLVLPAAFHGGRHDRWVSLILFTLFCAVHATEELAEVVSGDNFHLFTAHLLQHPREALSALRELPWILPGAFAALLLVAATVLLLGKRLMSERPAPPAPLRLFVPFLLVVVAFILMQAQTGLTFGHQHPELYRDGLFSLFGGIFALTAVPELSPIFARPCLGLAIALSGLWVLNCACTRYVGAAYAPLPLMQRLWRRLCSRCGRFRLLLFGLLTAAALVRLLGLGLYPLMDTTEARYGEMARKMLETGNWLQPQFEYGVPFWGKPPLSFQASALTMKLCGISAASARLAPFLAALALGSLFFCWSFARQRQEQGAAAFLVFLTSASGFVAAGAVMTDIFLAFGVMLSMVSFRRAVSHADASRLWGYLFFPGLAIGLLSKGPLALVLCGAPLLLWVALFRRWHDVRQRLPWFRGTLLTLALSVPWYLAAEKATPGFLRYFLWGEHVERYLIPGWQGDLYGAGHSRTPGTIWLYAIEMFLPWVLLVPFLLQRRRPTTFPDPPEAREAREARAYLWMWGLCPLVIFTPARNILPAYVLPGIPAFCLLLVGTLWKRAEHRPAFRSLLFLPAPLLLMMVLFAAGGGFSHLEYRCDRQMLQAWDTTSPLYYAGERIPYSGQFYSSGRAQRLNDRSPEELPVGTFLAVPESGTLKDTLSQTPGWQQVSVGHQWTLWHRE